MKLCLFSVAEETQGVWKAQNGNKHQGQESWGDSPLTWTKVKGENLSSEWAGWMWTCCGHPEVTGRPGKSSLWVTGQTRAEGQAPCLALHFSFLWAWSHAWTIPTILSCFIKLGQSAGSVFVLSGVDHEDKKYWHPKHLTFAKQINDLPRSRPFGKLYFGKLYFQIQY